MAKLQRNKKEKVARKNYSDIQHRQSERWKRVWTRGWRWSGKN